MSTEAAPDAFVWPEGWCSARLGNQRAFHYYRGGKSLCGKYRVAKSQLEFVSFRIPPDPMSIMFTNGSDCNVCQAQMRAIHVARETGMPRAGDKYRDGANDIEVVRVSKKHEWADIYVQRADGWMWSKRQPLPFPASFKRVTP